MRVKVSVVDDKGNQFEGDVILSPARQRAGRPVKTHPSVAQSKPRLDFGMNERAFAKQHASGLSGPKKFALLLAYFAKGNCGKEIEVKFIEKSWNKMTALLGGKFNGKYPNKAKEYGWADSSKQGVYVLRPRWVEILGAQGEDS
jgi:hypothetical protein